MAQKRPSKAKPKVAFETEAQALANIDAKLEAVIYLQRLAIGLGAAPGELRTGEPYNISRESPGNSQVPQDGSISLLSALPTSLRQFAAWSSDSLPEAYRTKVKPFERSAPQTVRRHLPTKKRVDAALAAVTAARDAATASKQSRRANALRSAQSEVRRLGKLLNIAETDLVQRLRQVSELESDVSELRSEIQSIELESKAEIKRLKAELSRVRAENATLARTISKVTPLKSYSKTKG
jgi:hypothetical protein